MLKITKKQIINICDKIAALPTLQLNIYSTKLVFSPMKYAEALSSAKRIGGIVIKTKYN